MYKYVKFYREKREIYIKPLPYYTNIHVLVYTCTILYYIYHTLSCIISNRRAHVHDSHAFFCVHDRARTCVFSCVRFAAHARFATACFCVPPHTHTHCTSNACVVSTHCGPTLTNFDRSWCVRIPSSSPVRCLTS